MDNTSPSYGGTGGQPFGPYTCPKGKYIKEFTGTGARVIDSVKGVCNDGTTFPVAGANRAGGGYFSRVANDGWTSVNGRYGQSLDNLLGAGGGGGASFNYTCPEGKKVVAYGGRQGWAVDAMYFGCDYDENYCVNNLESPACQATAVSKDVLNKACAKSMTATCVNRKGDLDESVMINYCKANPGEDICACYAPVPSYIDPSIRGLQQCWNNKCSSFGYKPLSMRSSQCPDIKICKNIISAEGENLLSSNVIKLDCSTKVVQSSSTPTTLPIPSTKPPEDELPSSSTNLYIILFVLLFIVVILMFYFGDDDTDTEADSSNLNT